jgi:acetyltransferase-like isoleucine patch superfamily enzyme
MLDHWYHYLATSDVWFARLARRVYRSVENFSVPAPRPIVRPLLTIILCVRAIYFFVARVFFCEPLFKAYCKRHGRNLHTGPYLHWIQGKGEIVLGDGVTIDGKCSFAFASRYTARPMLIIGHYTGIGHNCAFTIGRQIKIGDHCRIAADVRMFDSPGHPTDPVARLAHLPAAPEDVRSITIGDNVWIGRNAIIYPGVTIGNDSTVGMGAVVLNDVPSKTVVVGNPARQVRSVGK